MTRHPCCPGCSSTIPGAVFYNTVRLHSALGYVAPADRLEGRAEAIRAERDRKLAEARRGAPSARLLTSGKETPIIHPAGETDAGTTGEPSDASGNSRLPNGSLEN